MFGTAGSNSSNPAQQRDTSTSGSPRASASNKAGGDDSGDVTKERLVSSLDSVLKALGDDEQWAKDNDIDREMIDHLEFASAYIEEYATDDQIASIVDDLANDDTTDEDDPQGETSPSTSFSSPSR